MQKELSYEATQCFPGFMKSLHFLNYRIFMDLFTLTKNLNNLMTFEIIT